MKLRPAAQVLSPTVATVLLTLAAMVLSLAAARGVAAAWRVLPSARVAALTNERIAAVVKAAEPRLGPDVRAGQVHASLSYALLRAVGNPADLPGLRATAQALAVRSRASNLPRLQLALLMLLDFDAQSVPPAEWWPRLEPVLGGLEHASFDHFLPAVVAHHQQLYQPLVGGRGAARRLAEQRIGHPHGVFLQLLRIELDRLRAGISPEQAEVAALSTRLLRRLLARWTLDDGPLELRLVAAEELAVEIGRAATAAPGDAELAAALREWRAAVIGNIRARPTPIPQFAPFDRASPEWALPEYAAAVDGYWRLILTAIATAEAFVAWGLAAALALLLRERRAPQAVIWRGMPLPLVIGLLLGAVSVGAFAMTAAQTDPTLHFRAWSVRPDYLPVWFWLFPAASLIAVVVFGFGRKGWSPRQAATVALGVWAVRVAALVWIGYGLPAHVQRYEDAVADAVPSEQTGPAAQGAWNALAPRLRLLAQR